MTNNRRRGRGSNHRGLFSPQTGAVQAASRQEIRTMRDLQVATATKPLPDQRDRIPMRMPRHSPVITLIRTVSKGTVIANQFESVGAMSFTLADLPSYTDFTSLFDQYRIAQVTVRFLPTAAPFGPSTSSTSYPSFYTVIDYDDDTNPTSIDNLRQYSTLQVAPNQQYVERVLTPRFATAAYSGAFTSYSLAPVYTFIDSNSPGVRYYGVKWACSPVTTASGSFVLYNIEATYVIQLRNPH